jgi:fibronectin type 3 domain-containing protein
MKKLNNPYIMTAIMRIIFLLFTISIMCTPAISQQTQVKGAYGGAKGIFIYLKALTPGTPDNIAYCSIERKEAGTGEWQSVDASKMPLNESDFLKHLKTAIVNMPYDVSFLEKSGPQIWKKLQNSKSRDSLNFWFGMLPVQEALGVVYHDITAKPEVKYEYKVQQFDANGKSLKTIYSLPAKYPGEKSKWDVPYRSYSALSKQVTVTWGAPGAKLPPFVKVYRQNKNGGEWIPASSNIYSRTTKDSIIISATDAAVTPEAVYRYKLVPMDIFGNPGKERESDVVAVYNFSMEAPVIEELKAGNPDNTMGIAISWLISRNDLVNSIRIFRSTDYDKGYKFLTEVAPTVSIYTDQSVEPNTKYFYQIKLTGPMGELSVPSSRVFGISDDKSKPEPPMIVNAVGTKSGISLKISTTENNLSGIRVYRKNDKEKNLVPVSGLLPVKNNTITWEDTANISSIRFYGYAAKAENASHLQGDFSDTVYARSVKPYKVPTVMGLKGEYYETYNQLYWLNMNYGDNHVAGYIVYRKELPKGESKQINDTLVSENVNSYTDRSIAQHKSYAYSVVLVDEFGNKSAQCDPVTVNPPVIHVRPPATIAGNSEKSMIRISWGTVKSATLKEYKVYRYIRGTKPAVAGTVPAGGLTEFIDSKVIKGQLYFYYVTTIDLDSRQSNPSAEIGVRKK